MALAPILHSQLHACCLMQGGAVGEAFNGGDLLAFGFADLNEKILDSPVLQRDAAPRLNVTRVVQLSGAKSS